MYGSRPASFSLQKRSPVIGGVDAFYISCTGFIVEAQFLVDQIEGDALGLIGPLSDWMKLDFKLYTARVIGNAPSLNGITEALGRIRTGAAPTLEPIALSGPPALQRFKLGSQGLVLGYASSRTLIASNGVWPSEKLGNAE
jgi:hypothetical protein